MVTCVTHRAIRHFIPRPKPRVALYFRVVFLVLLKPEFLQTLLSFTRQEFVPYNSYQHLKHENIVHSVLFGYLLGLYSFVHQIKVTAFISILDLLKVPILPALIYHDEQLGNKLCTFM